MLAKRVSHRFSEAFGCWGAEGEVWSKRGGPGAHNFKVAVERVRSRRFSFCPPPPRRLRRRRLRSSLLLHHEQIPIRRSAPAAVAGGLADSTQ